MDLRADKRLAFSFPEDLHGKRESVRLLNNFVRHRGKPTQLCRQLLPDSVNELSYCPIVQVARWEPCDRHKCQPVAHILLESSRPNRSAIETSSANEGARVFSIT